YISTQEGETVVAGLSAPTFVTLIDLRKLEVTVFVDETDIGRVRVDQEATFAVDAYPEKTFRGTVREIHPKAVIKENVVNYEVILEIDRERRNLLRPEMTANVIIITGTHPDVLALPREAVKRLGPKTFAIVKTDGMLEERTIETGWRDGDFIEVVSGLEAGLEVGIPKKPQAAPVGVRRR
ncbi:MAG: HlyD family efflux transporter periplasmic adaptor subunit, partial [Nitrospinaceae bacterium]|nr:HlyD family efflux transporter periplasmic adaptor subunit [Nitrospinaceae bacterium]NIR55768.1 HlyD family efflux transporter periplasmic adaptor subunit [Nitrospinaceae bacterium]NIS86216.1 HlyD family efflux transporter periplasmic adaptor subunit [Nitrospinaceae bacterium]NIT83051.1 HlyD family efflux transporter periplasmic adaptor subunit [Nitrospinaceae bacterium]NIU45261.1 HlyD family efflux transporter periplasmic adaptor subunit [Nitrospinaceae bacterium]